MSGVSKVSGRIHFGSQNLKTTQIGGCIVFTQHVLVFKFYIYIEN
jgi:hypothetical protein